MLRHAKDSPSVTQGFLLTRIPHSGAGNADAALSLMFDAGQVRKKECYFGSRTATTHEAWSWVAYSHKFEALTFVDCPRSVS